MSIITTVAINTDNRCFSDCIHCPYGEKSADLLDVEPVLEFLYHFKAQGGEDVVLAAREPLASPTFERVSLPIIREAERLKLPVGVNCSARLLPRAIKALAKEGLRINSLYISMDGVNGVHDRIRGVEEEKYFPEILQMEEEIFAVTNSLGSSITVMRQNLGVLEETIRYAKELCLGEAVPFVAMCAENVHNKPYGTALIPGEFREVDRVVKRLGGSRELVLDIPSRAVPPEDIRGCKILRDKKGLHYIKTPLGNIWRYTDDKKYVTPVVRVLVSGEVCTSYDIDHITPVGTLGVDDPKTILARARIAKSGK